MLPERVEEVSTREEAMGGKRPDQHNIDPAEAGATDYKWGPEHQDEHIEADEKQKLQSNPHDQPMIPKSGVNPALRELQEKKQARTQPADEND
jgi:hypothetical protein